MDLIDVKQIKINGSEIAEVHFNNSKIWEKPPEYTRLEYIESTGTQFINTGVCPTSATNIDIDFAYVEGAVSKWIPIYGRRGNTKSTYFCLFIGQNNLKLTPNYGEFDPGNASNLIIPKGTKFNIRTDAGNLYYNGKLNTSCSTTSYTITNSTSPVYLFDLNPRMSRNTQMRLYECKFYENSVLIRDFIPVLDGNNVPCLYEKVNRTFYYNLGTGTFTYGLKGA